MSDIAEGLGAAIEGSLAANAVDPSNGAAGSGEAGECANCGFVGSGAFCSNCGQKRHVHRTLGAIGHDLMHGVLHLDGKLAHTLPLLTFRPGSLTRRYIEGERAKFVSPMAMFLFSVFAMFAVFQIVGLSAPTSFGDDEPETVEASLKDAATNARTELADIEEKIPTLDAGSERRGALEERKVELESDLTRIGEMTDLPAASDPAGDAQGDGGEASAAEKRGSEDYSLIQGETGIQFLDEGLAKKWNENPGLMLYKLQANAYKFSWLLIPLSIPFVWLLFAWKRRFKAYDHAIFVTYSLSFMSLLFITVSILGAVGVPVPLIVFSVLLVPPIHLYKHLRGTYSLSRLSSLWRLIVLSVFIWIVIALFLQVLVILGAF